MAPVDFILMSPRDAVGEIGGGGGGVGAGSRSCCRLAQIGVWGAIFLLLRL